ncbi:hypothetical protein JMN32_05160 [Fulvivirga sp. 29W222]|uniref:Uncharacterized protein n=1 Tax=Fulvivirga marina TaxID=2494733 RepID=A0A937FWL4_9BACT|nr:hypothetical protein [Fulvivirga marina]MBL6445686.1 hypothetical protein [Fulvivirga marina]
MGDSNDKNIEPIKQIPEMTNETWELLEFRLWEKISNKLWKLVGIFLTVVTIGGLLGINAFIDARIDRQVKEEKERLAEYEKELSKRNQQLTQFAKLITLLSNKLSSDRETFYLVARDIRASSDTLNLNQEKLKSVLDKLEGFWFRQDEYPQLIVTLTNLLENKEPNGGSQKIDTLDWETWQQFEEAAQINGNDLFPTILNLYAHILSSENALEKAIANQLKEYLIEPELKGSIQKLYEREFGEPYSEEWKKFHPWGGFSLSNGKYGWDNWPGLGRNAFIREEFLISDGNSPVF